MCFELVIAEDGGAVSDGFVPVGVYYTSSKSRNWASDCLSGALFGV